MILATDAPFAPLQINRLCKRAAMGVVRAGSYAAHGSGEIVVGFSTANIAPRSSESATYTIRSLMDSRMNPFYEAAVECTEEAIWNSLTMSPDMTGYRGHFSPGIDLEKLTDLYNQLAHNQSQP